MDALPLFKAQLPPAPARVLEVGCGEGGLARALDELGYRVTAIDPDAPAGAIFQAVSLEEFEDRGRFDAVVASRSLHHIPDLAGALSKIHWLLVPRGQVVVVEHAWERLDEPTARWYFEQLRAAAHPHAAPGSPQACLERWQADHADLHGYAALRRELDERFTERHFAWTPYLYGELGEEVEQEERRLIEAGAIQATGFVYVGERERPARTAANGSLTAHAKTPHGMPPAD
jgi:SAM-dependent methyltransferase